MCKETVTCINIAKRQKHLIVCKLNYDTIQRNLHLFIFHAMQTTLAIKHIYHSYSLKYFTTTLVFTVYIRTL